MAAAAAGLDHLNRQRVGGESGIISLEKKITIVALAALVAGIVLMALFPPLSTLFCVGIALGALSTTFLGTVAYHVLHKNPTKEEAAEELATLMPSWNDSTALLHAARPASSAAIRRGLVVGPGVALSMIQLASLTAVSALPTFCCKCLALFSP